MKEARFQLQAGLFRALMHPARLAILEALRHGEQCVGHVESVLGFRQAYISQQLATLRKVGLVEDRRDGWNVYYRVARPEVFALLDVSRAMVGGRLSAAPRGQPVEGCTCPRCALAAERRERAARNASPEPRKEARPQTEPVPEPEEAFTS